MTVRRVVQPPPPVVVTKPPPVAPPSPSRRPVTARPDELSTGAGRALRERATTALGSSGLSTGAAASTLATEDARDAQVNCLDAAYDYLSTLPAGREADVVFLDDVRPGDEGTDGHVLVREGGRLYDPATRTWHDSLEAFDPSGHYVEAGVLRGSQVTAILDAPVGSPERAAALANVPSELASMLVADTDLPSLAALTDGALGARELTAELDQQLARQIALYGPAMTDAQREQFVADFQAQHPEYAQLRAEQAELATFLRDDPGLRAQAASDPLVAASLAQAAEALAGTEHNDVVIELLRDEAALAAMTAAQGAEWVESHLLTPSVGAYATEALLAAGSDRAAAAAALDDVNALLATIGNVPALAEKVGQSAQLVGQMRDAYSAANGFDDLMRRLAVVNQNAGAMQAGGLARIGAGLTFVAGVALMADGVLSQDGERAFEGLLQAGQNADAVQYGLELLAKAMPSLGGAASTAARVVPVVSAVAHALTFLNQAGQLDSDSSRFQAASSFAQAAGGALMLTGAGVVPGAIISAIGVGLGIIGSALEGHEVSVTNQRFDAEAQALLAGLEPPVPAAVVSALHPMGPEAARALTEQLELTPEGWAEVARWAPGMLAALGAGGPGIIERFDALGLTSAQSVVSFAQSHVGSDPAVVQRIFEGLGTTSGTDIDSILAWIQEEIGGVGTASERQSSLPPSLREAVTPDVYRSIMHNVLAYANRIAERQRSGG